MQNTRPNMTIAALWGMNLMSGATEKPQSSWPFIRFSKLLVLKGFMYESGAILGRALGSKLYALEPLLGTPERQGESIAVMQSCARARLAQFAGQPRSFGLFIMESVLQECNLSLTSNKNLLKRAFDTKVYLEDAVKHRDISMAEGIGFGSLYPELTEELYRESYENPNETNWAEARRFGLNIAEHADVVFLEEREHDLLTVVAGYAAEFFPAQVSRLGLEGYLLRQAAAR